jgi:hypothetical protein
MKIQKIIYSLLILVLAIAPLSVFAQMFGGPPSFSPDVLDNPIDGGLSLLLGAGAAYGANRLRKSRRGKRNKKDS